MSEADNWQPPTPPAPSFSYFSEPRKANFGERLVATLCDNLNIFGLYVLLVFPVSILSAISEEIGIIAALFIFILLIFIRAKWEGEGGTPLRRKYGAVIVDKHTSLPIGTSRGFVRLLCRIPSGLVFYLGYFWMIWDQDSETWHDKMANTKVLKQ
jgi:uncharacterized RDD family membrane protein YckC